MSADLVIKNRQGKFPVNVRLLRQLALKVLPQLTDDGFDLCVYLVRASEMMHLNKRFLGHAGPTDVITFDYASNFETNHRQCPASRPTNSPGLHGEIFICLDEASTQARRFRTTWQSELVRYLIHGFLHLKGFDDRRQADRRRMKREEDRLLGEVESHGKLSKLAKASTLRKTRRRPKVAS